MPEAAGPGVGAAGPPPARTALVTGATSGIGREVAVGLARAGLAVGVLGRDADRLGAVLQGCRAAGGRAEAAAAEVTDLAGLQRAVAGLEAALGPTDLLVSAAGVIEAVEVPVWEADPAEWRRVVEVDLVGAFHAVRAVVPGMVARGGGRVVDLNSGSGVRDSAVHSAYGAAKAGLFRLGGALHAAGHERGLRVLELSPGVVDTPMTRAMGVHAGRTAWTDAADVVDLVAAFGRGDLDAWSGRMVRAGTDRPAALRERAAAGLADGARRLLLVPWGDDDPLT